MRHRTVSMWIGVVMAILLVPRAAGAQDPSNAELRKEIQILSDTIKAMQQELRDLRALVQRPQAGPQNVVLDLADRPFRGDAGATLTMIEFSDFQCPFCERHVRETYPQLVKDYVDTGKMKVVYMDFPLESIHRFAFKAAEAARCAGEQGKYFEMHDQLFGTQKTPADFSNWSAHAAAVGLNASAFEDCLASGREAGEIRKDLAQGQSAGITGTPGFFLALTDPSSTKVKTVRFINGAQSYSAFKAQIDAVLANR